MTTQGLSIRASHDCSAHTMEAPPRGLHFTKSWHMVTVSP